MGESDGAQGRFHGLEGRVYKVAVALLLVLVEREAHPPAPFTERRILGIWGTVDARASLDDIDMQAVQLCEPSEHHVCFGTGCGRVHNRQVCHIQ